MSQATREFHYRFVLPHGGGMEIDMLALTNYTFPIEAEKVLEQFGHSTLRLPPHPNLPLPVASHPDMLLFFAHNEILCTKSYAQIASKELQEISSAYGAPIRLINEEYKDEYPHDVLLNALTLGENLFCNTKTVAKELLSLELLPQHVHQGYAKCSILPLGSQALITSDPSIAKRAIEIGIDVLQIQQGYISLPGYEYGFIGGCTSFSPRNKVHTIFFCGNLSHHPDKEKIESFCKKHNYGITCLTNAHLYDTGTIFLI